MQIQRQFFRRHFQFPGQFLFDRSPNDDGTEYAKDASTNDQDDPTDFLMIAGLVGVVVVGGSVLMHFERQHAGRGADAYRVYLKG
mmetsp:Transcript_30505/g.46987  ORF Transcript_30505/g.46987 Transcript_30505/m.46987 type:complete len:85 (-) Transcript_30505:9-263(-)